MTDDNREREAFEAWAINEGWRNFARDGYGYAEANVATLWVGWQARASCAPSQVPRERLCNNQRESAYAFSAWLASEYEDISLDDDDTVRQQMEHAWREAMKVANNEVTE